MARDFITYWISNLALNINGHLCFRLSLPIRLKTEFYILFSRLRHLFSILNTVLSCEEKVRILRSLVEACNKIVNQYSCGNMI